MEHLFLFLLLGFSAGILAGLFGVGGGLIVVAALAVIAPKIGVPATHVMHVALATALAGIVFTSLSSGYAHSRRGAVLWPTVRAMLPGLLLGAALGAWLASLVQSDWLKMGVGVFCLLAAWQMWRPRNFNPNAHDAPQGRIVRLAGFVIGTIAAMVGIGGGSLTVPFLIRQHAEPVRAVATSAVCGFPIALASAIAYAFVGRNVSGLPEHTWGFVYLPAALCIAGTSVIAAPFGARLAHSIGGLALKRAFAVFLILIGFTLLW